MVKGDVLGFFFFFLFLAWFENIKTAASLPRPTVVQGGRVPQSVEVPEVTDLHL